MGCRCLRVVLVVPLFCKASVGIQFTRWGFGVLELVHIQGLGCEVEQDAWKQVFLKVNVAFCTSGTKVTVGTRSESQYLVLVEVDGVRWLLSPPAPPCCPLCSVLIPSLLQVLFNNTFCHNFNCYIECHQFNGKSIGRTCKNIFVQNRCIFECTTNIFGALKQDLIPLILMGKLGISHQNSDKGLQL